MDNKNFFQFHHSLFGLTPDEICKQGVARDIVDDIDIKELRGLFLMMHVAEHDPDVFKAEFEKQRAEEDN